MARVFIDMLPDDNLEVARAEAERVPDERMTAFHDPEKQLGRAMARRLGWERHVAWDIFLVYGPGEAWTATQLPAPASWFHQLNDGEPRERADAGESADAEEPEPPAEEHDADPARFRTGEDLRSALIEAIRTAAGTAAEPA